MRSADKSCHCEAVRCGTVLGLIDINVPRLDTRALALHCSHESQCSKLKGARDDERHRDKISDNKKKKKKRDLQRAKETKSNCKPWRMRRRAL